MVLVVNRYLVEKLAVKVEAPLPAVTVHAMTELPVVPSGELVVLGVVAEGLAGGQIQLCRLPEVQAKRTGVGSTVRPTVTVRP